MTDAQQRLDLLYRTYAADAFRRARRLLGDHAEAHEVVHDVFVSLFERPEQHAGTSRMSTFLYSAVTHACLNRLRDRKTRQRLLAENAERVAPREPAHASADQQVLLRSLLSRLPRELAQLAVYRHMDELTHEEIAEIMGCSRRHVGDLLQRLRAWIETREGVR